MLFCKWQYFIFFGVVFALYWSLPWRALRVWLLLAASFYFYACWNHWLALIVFGSTFLDYWLARGMDHCANRWVRRGLLSISLGGNLGLLVYFKYANFFLRSLEEMVRAAGGTASLPLLKVILPVGISFYTFEAINYTVDVFRRKIAAERNLGNFLLFITFFPHLVAGPIVRARDFLPQVRRPKRFSWPRMQLGLWLFLVGLFKKVAIADRMVLFADPIFWDPYLYGSYANWVGLAAYTLQIYCDFSGYSDMALGSAHMLGYKLAVNFNMPYLSANVSEFWRRWHISLSSWLRDYLFIPLGGSRGGGNCPHCRDRLTERNLLLTMTLGGMWHGANWTFVIWGVYHGLCLVVHRRIQRFCKGLPTLERFLLSPLGTPLRVGTTLLCVMAGWVFFRAPVFDVARRMFWRLLLPTHGGPTPVHDSSFWYTLALVALCHFLAASGWWDRVTRRLPAPVLGAGYAVVLSFALVLNFDVGTAFIYFQF